MTPNFTIDKSIRGGHIARSFIDIENNRSIKITTMKSLSGILYSSLVVGKSERDIFSYLMFQDFQKCLIQSNKRATLKQIETQHKEALAMIDSVLPEINAHYNKSI